MGVKKVCVQCQHQMVDSANYCENCGSKVSAASKRDLLVGRSEALDQLTSSKSNSRGQTLIFTGLIILCSGTIYYFIIGAVIDFSENWELYEVVEPFSLFFSFVSSGIALLIAFGLNAGTRKTLGIIFASIYALINLYWFIDRLIPDEAPFQYLQF